MTKQKQTNNETGAVLIRATPEQDRSLIMVPKELRRAYPNVQPEYMQKALERCREQQCPEDETTIGWFGKILAAVLIDEPSESGVKSMNILEDLWFGNISPWERPFKKDSAYAELLALVVRHQEDLLSRLNDEEKEIFEKFADCTTEMHDLTEREAFVKGFTIGARIIIAVMAAGGDK